MVVVRITVPSELFAVVVVRDTTPKSGRCLGRDVATFAEVLKDKVETGLYDPVFFYGKKKPTLFECGSDSRN